MAVVYEIKRGTGQRQNSHLDRSFLSKVAWEIEQCYSLIINRNSSPLRDDLWSKIVAIASSIAL